VKRRAVLIRDQFPVAAQQNVANSFSLLWANTSLGAVPVIKFVKGISGKIYQMLT
jgi:hypothetical protein